MVSAFVDLGHVLFVTFNSIICTGCRESVPYAVYPAYHDLNIALIYSSLLLKMGIEGRTATRIAWRDRQKRAQLRELIHSIPCSSQETGFIIR